MKKNYFPIFIIFIIFLSACSKKQVDLITGSMDVDISGAAHFSAVGKDQVVGQIDSTNGSRQFTITASSGTRVISLAILNYNDALGTYTFDYNTTSDKRAIGGYNSGGGSDDIIVSGTLQVTQASPGHLTAGTFSGTTQKGVVLTNGTFSSAY